ncbi:MAG: tellurite resistance/C4-dicarboxylate transporter family protein [Thermoanaerobaculia bacterium]
MSTRGSAIETLHPAYFALVMATGICSIAAQLLGIPYVPKALLWINAVSFVALWLLTAMRIVRYPRAVFADLLDHQRGVGFFTAVAATSVFGSQLAIVAKHTDFAMPLWYLTIVLWGVLVYAVFTAYTVKETKPPLDKGISGGWLVAVVATQSVSTLASLIAPSSPHAELLLFVSLTFWLAGGMLYIWLISLIFYRYTFFSFAPSDLMPPYWINMGAMAISTLAGTLLLADTGSSPLLADLRPFLLGFTMFFWATATWWIPMLVILGVWRHVYKRFPLTYNPLYWGAVFPLGMYTVCTYRLAQVTHVAILTILPKVFVYIALAAWTATFVGLIRSFVGARASSPPARDLPGRADKKSAVRRAGCPRSIYG